MARTRSYFRSENNKVAGPEVNTRNGPHVHVRSCTLPTIYTESIFLYTLTFLSESKTLGVDGAGIEIFMYTVQFFLVQGGGAPSPPGSHVRRTHTLTHTAFGPYISNYTLS